MRLGRVIVTALIALPLAVAAPAHAAVHHKKSHVDKSAHAFAGTRTVGALFFPGTYPFGHFCSASVIRSPGHNIIMTAAHCLQPQNGSGYTFVPAYDNGKKPYGAWKTTAVYADPKWIKDDGDNHRDFAFLTIAPQTIHGKRKNIQDVVGGNHLGLRAHSGESVRIVGYPGTFFPENTSDGDRALRCVTRVYIKDHVFPASHCHGFGDGTSGGPWLAGHGKTRTVVGDIAGLHQGGCTTNVVYSSALGKPARAALKRAEHHKHPNVMPQRPDDGCATPINAGKPNTRASSTALIGLREGDYHSTLTNLDFQTLMPAGQRKRLPDAPDAFIENNTGQLAAFSEENHNRLAIVRLSDLETVRQITTGKSPRYGPPEATPISWASKNRILGYTQEFNAHEAEPARLFVANTHSGRLLVNRSLHGSDVASARLPGGGIALLLSPVSRIGGCRLVLVSPTGLTRQVKVPQVKAGYVDPGDAPESRSFEPALAVNRSTAYIVGGRAPIATVNRRTLHVSYHAVPRLMSQHLATGPAEDEGSAGALLRYYRTARLVSHGRQLLVGGLESHPLKNGKIRYLTRADQIVDLEHWRIKHTFVDTTETRPAHGGFIGADYGRRSAATGPYTVTSWTNSFRPRFRLPLTMDQTFNYQVGRLFVGNSWYGSGAAEYDPVTGRKIGTLPKGSYWLDELIPYRGKRSSTS